MVTVLSASHLGAVEGSRYDDVRRTSCLVFSLRPLLATGPAGSGGVADRLAGRLTIPPGGNYILWYVRAPSGHPVSARSPFGLAIKKQRYGLASHSSRTCFSRQAATER